MTRIILVGFTAALAGLSASSSFAQQQSADLDYDTTVAAPAYKTQHPAVLFDEAHNNLHTAGGLYKPFADLVSNDGYRVTSNKKALSKEVLEPYQILIIANATGAPGGGPDAANPAFTAAECQAVEAWVKEGGSFLFITDHYPYGAAAQTLAKRFGVGMSQGQTLDPQNSVQRIAGRLYFAQENGLLGDHPIVRGRGPSEQINRVITYSGQSLGGPRGSVPFLLLADTAFDRSMVDNAMVSAAGRCQGLAFIHGKGRVVVLGEAAVLSAQFDAAGRPVGMNDPGTDNRQLSLNIMHWLSGVIPVNPRTAKKAAASRRAAASRKAKSGTPKPKAQAPQPELPVEDP
jgi:hypothetical protein